MARSHARLGTDIWAEETIRTHTRDAQRAYLLVLSQPELSRCGVLPYRLKRLASLARDDTPTKLRKAFTALQSTRHLVVDEDAEELLVRTYVRHDGLLTQPQVVATMVTDFALIESAKIRTAFLHELRRIWDHPRTTDAERKGLRLALGEHETDRYVERLGEALGPAMGAAIEAGSVPAFDPGCQAGCPAPFAQPLAGAPARSPVPTPSPAPTPSPSAPANGHPAGHPALPGGEHTPHADVELLLDQTGPYVPKIRAGLADELAPLAAAGIPPSKIAAALQVWRGRKAGVRLIGHLVQDQLTPAEQADPRFAGLLADARSSA